jgi:RNA polymerase sigma-70 factor, ECF subfamily
MKSHDNHEQFVHLFTKHRHRIYGTIRMLVPHAADADDILQDLSITLLRKFDTFKPGTHFEHWACAIARFHVLNYRRRLRQDRHVFSQDVMALIAETESQNNPGGFPQDVLDILESCKKKLADRYQHLLSLRLIEQLSNREIARQMDRNEATVSRSFAKIYKKLLDCVNHFVASDCQGVTL